MNVHANPASLKAAIPQALRDWLAQPRKLLVDGKWVAAQSGKTFDVHDPATGEKLAAVAEGDKADIDAKTATLNTAAQKLGEKMYADMQAQQAAGGEGQQAPGAEQAAPQDDVVDADFKEVKDK